MWTCNQLDLQTPRISTGYAQKSPRSLLYTMVEKCTRRSRVLAQDMVLCGNVGDGMPEKMKRQYKYFIQVVGLRRSRFLAEAVRLPKKLDLRRIPLQKSVCHVGIHVIFHPCMMFSTKRLLAIVQTTARQECFSRPIKFRNSPRIHD